MTNSAVRQLDIDICLVDKIADYIRQGLSDKDVEGRCSTRFDQMEMSERNETLRLAKERAMLGHY